MAEMTISTADKMKVTHTQLPDVAKASRFPNMAAPNLSDTFC